MTSTTIAIDGVVPASTFAPSTTQDSPTLGEANAAGQTVAPVGGGTQLDLGMPPHHLDLNIETTNLNPRRRVREPADLTVTVEARMRVR